MERRRTKEEHLRLLEHFLADKPFTYEDMLSDYEKQKRWALATLYPYSGSLPQPKSRQGRLLAYNFVSEAMRKNGNKAGYCQTRFVELLKDLVDPEYALHLVELEVRDPDWQRGSKFNAERLHKTPSTSIFRKFLNALHQWMTLPLGFGIISVYVIFIIGVHGLQRYQWQNAHHYHTQRPTKTTFTTEQHLRNVPTHAFGNPFNIRPQFSSTNPEQIFFMLEGDAASQENTKRLVVNIVSGVLNLTSISISNYNTTSSLAIATSYLNPESRVDRQAAVDQALKDTSEAWTRTNQLVFQALTQLHGFISGLESEDFSASTIPDVRFRRYADIRMLDLTVSQIINESTHRFYIWYHFFLATYSPKAAYNIEGCERLLYAAHDPVMHIKYATVDVAEALRELLQMPIFDMKTQETKDLGSRLVNAISEMKQVTEARDKDLESAELACHKPDKKPEVVIDCLLDHTSTS
ncbi:hypothetical protein PVAG01_11100 [Phlyctema vagabunda]|uniref:Uncharacterized protein n=1 Tax=Phlyctema vagabunda TaxID=108571 RepID=A0ABR4P1C2_9HELO